MDFPADKMGHLMLAANQLAGPVSTFLDADTPDVFIHDFFFSWLPPLARRCGVPTVFFSVFSAASIAIVGPPSTGDGAATWPASPADLSSPAPWIPFPTSVTFRPHEAISFYQILCLPNSTGVSNATRFHAVINGASAVAVRTCTELEPDFLQLLPKLYNKPALPIGVLRPDNGVSIGGGGSGGGLEMDWLDGRPVGSTVYAVSGVRQNSDKNM